MSLRGAVCEYGQYSRFAFIYTIVDKEVRITLLMNDANFHPDDLPLAKELAGMLTLEIRRFLLEKNKQDGALSNKTLSIVSHELKTPVTSLKTVLQVLQRRMHGDPAKFNFSDNAEYVDFSLREIDRLTVLVNDLLDFNRLNRGALQFNFINTDAQIVVAAAVEHMRVLCSTHKIEFSGLDEPYFVSMDAPRFTQAIDNFLTNAIKYSPEGSIISVKLIAGEKSLAIAIHNEGAGIPAEDQERLFEPYYRTPDAEASSIGGLGIGLFISKQIVETHNGTVELSSQPRKGVTITITLPWVGSASDGEVTHKKNTPFAVSPPPKFEQ